MDPALYIIMRNDLDSMNCGKAVAQGAHIANKFVADYLGFVYAKPELFNEWEADRGFGTTIVLSANKEFFDENLRGMRNYAFGYVYDESYPYILHKEYADLITHSEKYPPVDIGNDMRMCFREELVGAYVFGEKGDCQQLVGDLPLMD